MKLHDFCERMEHIAPKSLALDFDNVGLLITPEHDEIKKVLVALDLTVPVAEESIRGGYDLVLTHHPIFWDPVKAISKDDPDTAAAYRLIRHGISAESAYFQVLFRFVCLRRNANVHCGQEADIPAIRNGWSAGLP